VFYIFLVKLSGKKITVLTVISLLLATCPALSQLPFSSHPILVAQSNESRARSFFQQGQQQLGRRENEGAITSFNRAISLDPNFGFAYAFRGVAHEQLRNFEEAIADYTQAIRLLPNGLDKSVVFFNRGNVYSRYPDRAQEAINDFTQAIRLNPRYADAYYKRGFVRSERNDARGSIGDFTTAIEIAPNHLSAYAQRGLTLSSLLGDDLAATQDFVRVVRLQARTAEDYWNRGVSRQVLGDLSGSISDFSQAIRLEPNSIRAYYSRALVKYMRGDEQGAGADLQSAVNISNLSPNNVLVGDLQLAMIASSIYIQLEQYQNALDVLKPATRADPQNSILYFYRAQAHLAQGNQESALAALENAISLDQNFAVAYQLRSNIYFQQEKLGQALTDINTALSLSPNFASAYIDRASIYLQQNNEQAARLDLSRANALYDRVIRLNPSDAVAYTRRGYIAQILGNMQQATSSYQRALELYQQQGNQVAYAASAESVRYLVARGNSILYEEGVLEEGDQIIQDDNSLYDKYTFQGRAGQSVTIQLNSDDFDTYLIVIGPRNQVLGENDDSSRTNVSSQLVVTLPETGTYQVFANALDERGRGRYILRVR